MTYPNPKNIVHVTNDDIIEGRTQHVTINELKIINALSAVVEAARWYSDSLPISANATDMTVSGLDFIDTPVFLNVSVIRPNNTSPQIFASTTMDTITSGGFDVDFSDAIPTSGYYLSYIVKV